MRIKHFYRFPKHITDKFDGDILDQENWDILRMDGQTEHFSIPSDKQKYDTYCAQRRDYEKRAERIIELLYEYGCLRTEGGSLCSIEVGMGVLEWHIINKYPSLRICCSDYTPGSLRKLELLLNADSFILFDLLKDDFANLSEYDCLILYRVSTEFSFDEWRDVFYRGYLGRCKRICFVPTEFATEEDADREQMAHEQCMRKDEKDMFCGWLYSEDEFVNMFSDWYEIDWLEKIDNTGIYLLSRKNEIRQD